MEAGKPIRILIVDDHPVVREGLAALISRQPDMVLAGEAANGREAVERFRRERPDVTLMDLRLPDMRGIEATALILAEFPAARVVMLTSYDGDADIHRSLQAGARGYLLKDMPGGELLEAVRAVHAGQRRFPPRVAQRLAEHLQGSELTAREHEVLELIVRGKSNKQIAGALGITEGTVKGHVNGILGKLGVSDRTQAAMAALQRGIVYPG